VNPRQKHTHKQGMLTDTSICRELPHESNSDWSSHYTAGAVDKNGEWISSVHIHAEEEAKEDKKAEKEKKKKDRK